MTYVISLRAEDGTCLTASSYNTHRAALFNLYRDYGEQMPVDLTNELKVYFKGCKVSYSLGLKATIAKEIQAGDAPIKIGKDPLDFSVYQFLAMQFLKNSGKHKECIFAHCFFLLCWNLMCRAANTESICLDHIEWKDDCFAVYFAHQKNDQMGEKPRDPRHIYANPLFPHICPLLSLAIFLLCFPITDQTIQLFPGKKQYERFRQIFSRLMSQEEISNSLKTQG